MLRRLILENFKAFGEAQTAVFAPITLVFGPNSGGKSSLIQALALLRQSAGESERKGQALIPRGELIDLGSFRSLLHKHELKRELGITVEYDHVKDQRSSIPKYRPASIRGHASSKITLKFKAAKSRYSRKFDSSTLDSVHYQVNDGALMDIKLVKEDSKSHKIPGRLHDPEIVKRFRWADELSLQSYASLYREKVELRSRFRKTSQETLPTSEEIFNALEDSIVLPLGMLPVHVLAGDNFKELSKRSSELPYTRLPDLSLAYEYYELMNSISYLGPLRIYPERHYLISGGVKDTVGVRGENTPQMIYRQPKEITRAINMWFERFGIPYTLKVKLAGDEITGEIIAMNLLDQRTGVRVAPSDVGFGIGQLLPIVVEGMISQNKIICVEQPEIHLHPKLQAEVADFLIETSGISKNMGPRGQIENQWIIETHSEAVILRIQRRIRESVISASDVSVIYVQPTSYGATVMPLRLDSKGKFLDEWPDGFFEESYMEIFSEELE